MDNFSLGLKKLIFSKRDSPSFPTPRSGRERKRASNNSGKKKNGRDTSPFEEVEVRGMELTEAVIGFGNEEQMPLSKEDGNGWKSEGVNDVLREGDASGFEEIIWPENDQKKEMLSPCSEEKSPNETKNPIEPSQVKQVSDEVNSKYDSSSQSDGLPQNKIKPTLSLSLPVEMTNTDLEQGEKISRPKGSEMLSLSESIQDELDDLEVRAKAERHKPITKDQFDGYFDMDGRIVDESELKRTIFKGGVEEAIRRDVWQFLFELYPCNTTMREREVMKMEHAIRYDALKTRWRPLLKQIEKDPKSGVRFCPEWIRKRKLSTKVLSAEIVNETEVEGEVKDNPYANEAVLSVRGMETGPKNDIIVARGMVATEDTTAEKADCMFIVREKNEKNDDSYLRRSCEYERRGLEDAKKLASDDLLGCANVVELKDEMQMGLNGEQSESCNDEGAILQIESKNRNDGARESKTDAMAPEINSSTYKDSVGLIFNVHGSTAENIRDAITEAMMEEPLSESHVRGNGKVAIGRSEAVDKDSDVEELSRVGSVERTGDDHFEMLRKEERNIASIMKEPRFEDEAGECYEEGRSNVNGKPLESYAAKGSNDCKEEKENYKENVNGFCYVGKDEIDMTSKNTKCEKDKSEKITSEEEERNYVLLEKKHVEDKECRIAFGEDRTLVTADADSYDIKNPEVKLHDDAQFLESECTQVLGRDGSCASTDVGNVGVDGGFLTEKTKFDEELLIDLNVDEDFLEVADNQVPGTGREKVTLESGSNWHDQGTETDDKNVILHFKFRNGEAELSTEAMSFEAKTEIDMFGVERNKNVECIESGLNENTEVANENSVMEEEEPVHFQELDNYDRLGSKETEENTDSIQQIREEVTFGEMQPRDFRERNVEEEINSKENESQNIDGNEDQSERSLSTSVWTENYTNKDIPSLTEVSGTSGLRSQVEDSVLDESKVDTNLSEVTHEGSGFEDELLALQDDVGVSMREDFISDLVSSGEFPVRDSWKSDETYSGILGIVNEQRSDDFLLDVFKRGDATDGEIPEHKSSVLGGNRQQGAAEIAPLNLNTSEISPIKPLGLRLDVKGHGGGSEVKSTSSMPTWLEQQLKASSPAGTKTRAIRIHEEGFSSIENVEAVVSLKEITEKANLAIKKRLIEQEREVPRSSTPVEEFGQRESDANSVGNACKESGNRYEVDADEGDEEEVFEQPGTIARDQKLVEGRAKVVQKLAGTGQDMGQTSRIGHKSSLNGEMSQIGQIPTVRGQNIVDPETGEDGDVTRNKTGGRQRTSLSSVSDFVQGTLQRPLDHSRKAFSTANLNDRLLSCDANQGVFNLLKNLDESISKSDSNVYKPDHDSQLKSQMSFLEPHDSETCLYCGSWVESGEAGPENAAGDLKQYVQIQAKVHAGRQVYDIDVVCKALRIIDKDVPRTDRELLYFRGNENPNLLKLRDALITYAFFHPDVGYAQGMNDIMSRFFVVMDSEADAYWMFCNYMEHFKGDFMESDMLRKITLVEQLLMKMDRELYDFFQQLELELIFCHRWLLLSFKREFSYEDGLRIFEIISSRHLEVSSVEAEMERSRERARELEKEEGSRMEEIYISPEYSFDVFVCVAMLQECRDILMSNNDVASIYQILSRLPQVNDLDVILSKAEDLFFKYCRKSTMDCFQLIDEPVEKVLNWKQRFHLDF